MAFVVRKSVAKAICSRWGLPLVQKSNPYHDQRGRFASCGGEPIPTGRGDFGDIYECFKGKPNEAVKFLLKKKGGEAVGALHHKDVGDIDLVWGKEGTGHGDGYGLSKLARFHPEVLSDLQGILDDMKVISKTGNRVQLESEKYKAGIRLEWNGKNKKWLLTAYEKEGDVSDSRTDIARTETSQKDDYPSEHHENSIPQSVENATKKLASHPRLVVQKSVARAIYKANPHHDGRGRFASGKVAHAGEYVLTRSGSKDFGEITQEIANSIGRQAGKIRLRRGVQVDGAKGNWGEKHIERLSRLRDLNNVGFSSARDFVEYTCKDFDTIYKNGRNLIVAKREKRRNLLLYVELVPSKDGNFYDVKTAFPTRRAFLKKKTLLWEKSVSSVQKSEKERAPTNQFFNEESHRAKLTGISDDRIIPQSAKNASEKSKKISKKHPRLVVRKSVAREICSRWGLVLIQKSNPHHDQLGRFAAGSRECASDEQIAAFVEAALQEGGTTKTLVVGKITDAAKARIKAKTGITGVERVVIDTSSVRHSLGKANHNLTKEDFLKIADVVNTSDDITLDNKRHSDNETGVFFERTDDKNTALKLVMEFRKKSGNLALVSFYRQKKKRATAPMPTEVSPKLTSETVTAHKRSIPHGKQNASDKSLCPRFMVRKSVARAICQYWGLPLVQKSNPYHDQRGRFASCGEGASQKKLSEYIEAILDGTKEQTKGLERTYFQMAETPQELKTIGLTGDLFTVRYGVISRHKDKDASHNLSADEWKVLCKRLESADNLVVAKRDEGFNIFVGLPSTTLVGVSVKNVGKSVEVNSVRTVFKREIKEADEIVYPKGGKMSPEQSALLDRKKLSISASSDTLPSAIVPHGKQNASDKVLSPRLMVKKSVARRVLRQEYTGGKRCA